MILQLFISLNLAEQNVFLTLKVIVRLFTCTNLWKLHLSFFLVLLFDLFVRLNRIQTWNLLAEKEIIIKVADSSQVIGNELSVLIVFDLLNFLVTEKVLLKYQWIFWPSRVIDIIISDYNIIMWFIEGFRIFVFDILLISLKILVVQLLLRFFYKLILFLFLF